MSTSIFSVDSHPLKLLSTLSTDSHSMNFCSNFETVTMAGGIVMPKDLAKVYG